MPLALNAPRKSASRKRKAQTGANTPRKRPLVTQQPPARPATPGGNGSPGPEGDEDAQPVRTEPETNEEPISELYDVDDLKHTGRIVGRMVDMWDSFTLILNAGVVGIIRKSGEPTTNLERYRQRACERLMKLVPDLLEILTELEAQEDEDADAIFAIDAALDHGRKQTRTEDRGVCNIEGVHWFKDFKLPAIKGERGFQHEGCGRHLCPADEDWDDLSVRTRLRKHGALHDQLPRHLWPSGPDGFNVNNFWGGFCRSEQLVSAVTAILLSRTYARGTNRSTRHGVAELYDAEYIDLPVIVYAATLNQFTLHEQANLTAGPGQIGEAITDDFKAKAKRSWPFRLFYYSLMHDLEVTMPSKDRADLLTWWNDLLFPKDNGTDLAAEPEEGSLRARMAAQAEERAREQEEATREQEDGPADS